MRKHFPLILAATLAVFSPFITSAQQCQWMAMTGGSTADICHAIAIDAAGNSYVAGFFTGTVDFGLGPLVAMGGTDAFILKRDPVGIVLWVRVFGGSHHEEICGLATSDDGFVYAVGWFQSPSLPCGNAVVLSNTDTTSHDAMLITLDFSGNTVWARQSGGASSEQAYAVDCGPSGIVIVVGSYFDTASFGSSVLPSYGGRDAFVIGYDSAGTLLFTEHGGGPHDDGAYGVACDPAGAFFCVTGHFNFGPMQSDSARFGNQVIVSSGYTDIFLACYDMNDTCQWVRGAGGGNFGDEGRDVAISDAGEIYVTGLFSGTAFFGTSAVSTNSTADAFVASYDPMGALRWVASTASVPQGNAVGYSIAIDDAGNPTIAGGFECALAPGQCFVASDGSYDLFAAGFDRADGTCLWAAQGGGRDEDWACAIAFDLTGSCYMAGVCMSAPMQFGSCIGATAGQPDGFVAKFGVPLGLSEAIADHSSLSMYPNPFTDQFTIELPIDAISEIVLRDISGREIMRMQVTGRVIIPRNNLPDGLYMLAVLRGGVLCGTARLIAQ